MRRMILSMLALLFFSVISSAQDWDFGSDNYETKRHNWGIELGVGGTGSFTIDVGFRWQMNLHEFVSWDVLTLKALVAPEYFTETITPQLMTGIHLNSPQFFGISAYLLGRGGYGRWIDAKTGGFCLEIGAGLNVTKHISVGYAYDQQKSNEFKMKYNAFRIGFLF